MRQRGCWQLIARQSCRVGRVGAPFRARMAHQCWRYLLVRCVDMKHRK